MKRFTSIILALMLSALCHAATPQWDRSHFRCGLEWGYSGSFLMAYHNNYIEATDGYRIDDSGRSMSWRTNAYCAAVVGWDPFPRLNASFIASYTGIYGKRRAFFLSFRPTWFRNGVQNDGLLAFLEGGVGVDENLSPNPIISLKTGGGYRVALSRLGDIDFMLSLRGCIDHPDIWDEWEQVYVEKDNVRKNNALYLSVCLGVGISF